jgi:hypothetical protein
MFKSDQLMAMVRLRWKRGVCNLFSDTMHANAAKRSQGSNNARSSFDSSPGA